MYDHVGSDHHSEPVQASYGLHARNFPAVLLHSSCSRRLWPGVGLAVGRLGFHASWGCWHNRGCSTRSLETGVDVWGQIQYDFNRNKYFTVEEAKEYGLIDTILRPPRVNAMP